MEMNPIRVSGGDSSFVKGFLFMDEMLNVMNEIGPIISYDKIEIIPVTQIT